MAIPKDLAARAVLELTDGRKIYIEVQDGSMFVKFYTVYAIRGRGRAREYKVYPSHPRIYANRIEDAGTKMAKHFDKFGNAKVTNVTVKIFRKRLYKKRFNMRPDELGLTRVRPLFSPPNRTAPQLFTGKSSRRRRLTASSHTTGHAGPHPAVQRE